MTRPGALAWVTTLRRTCEPTIVDPVSIEPPTARQTRVDIYATDGEGLHGKWIGCGSLVAPRLVVPHVRLPQTTDLPVVCVLVEDHGEVIEGRTLGSADGAPATAVGLGSPSSQPVAHTPRIPDLAHGERLDRWLETIARHSGCTHNAPGEPAEQPGPEAPWYCRIWSTAPGCR